MKPIRSFLFVPGSRASWIDKIPGYHADAVILDLEGLRVAAQAHRRLGYVGEMLLHPSNVAVANEVYSPSDEEIAYYKGMLKVFDAAQAEGRAAVIYDGEHIAYAHVKTAREIVEQSRAFHTAAR